ncbi:RNA-directed DNA polymerase (reverse transcriptase) [Euphorbia peplus]|nr:RNA-directed DNA polymerase (reverse transcriptase) [Euphorbia peplus]
MCVSSVSFAFLINGQPKRFVKPSRGLRQGDPISPYLFLICAEALSSKIRKAEVGQLLHGVRVCQGAPRVSHLFFADDSLIFRKATLDEVITIQNILARYEVASGQMVNFVKSEIFFSKGVPDDRKIAIADQLGVRIT